MPRCSSRARSLPARTRASAPKDSCQHLGTSSQIRYRSGEGAIRWSCLLCHGPPVAAAPQPASPELLGSQELPALSQKVPLLAMPLAVRRAGTPGVVARSEVPADRRVDDRCSCVRCDGYEPTII
jgi:hypothetical protein